MLGIDEVIGDPVIMWTIFLEEGQLPVEPRGEFNHNLGRHQDGLTEVLFKTILLSQAGFSARLLLTYCFKIPFPFSS